MPRFFQGPRCVNKVRLDGKVAVITGANTGIGKETALDFSRRGAEVVIASRDTKKAEDAAKEINKETGNKVSVVKLDLGSMASIRTAAAEIKEKYPLIHLLVNNAGVMTCPQWSTEDGFEMQFGVNHLGHFLWTNLLLENVKRAAPARIVNLSSVAHENGKMYFEDLMLMKNYTPLRAYCQSKLANILFTKELAKRLEGTGVWVFAVHPGVVQTELGRHLGDSYSSCAQGTINFFSNFFAKTPEMGAQTTIYCATEESLEKHNGKYFSDCAVTKTTKLAEDMNAAKKLWKFSEEFVHLAEYDK